MNVGLTKICFVSCHLPHGQDNVDKRNEDFNVIIKEIEASQQTIKKGKANQVIPEKQMSDCMIMVGDFNYRINGTQSAIIEAMHQNLYQDLLYND